MTTAAEPQAWHAGAEPLADWASGLANRDDVWGGYNAPERRGQTYTDANGQTKTIGTTTTRPVPSKRGQLLLTRAVLVRHFRPRGPEDVVGLHTTSAANTCLWGSVELDVHGDGGNKAEHTTRAALAWYARLRFLGLAPLLWDSNGKGGFHLDAIFTRPVPSARVFAFLRWLVRDFADHGLSAPPETFPKQPALRPGQVGNWLRLVGRHHTREHWARVWSGDSWLGGAEAVAFILGIRGDDPAFIPHGIDAPPVRVQPTGRRRTDRKTPDDALGRRIDARLAKLANLGEGQGRDNVAFGFAAWLVRDLQLSDPDALPWLLQWDEGNTPPKGEARLKEILENVHRYGAHSYGQGLRATTSGRSRRRPARRATSFTVEV